MYLLYIFLIYYKALCDVYEKRERTGATSPPPGKHFESLKPAFGVW